MQNRKYLSKKHIFTKNIRRGISFLLSLCMVSSLFCGVAVFAQEPGQTVPQEPAQANLLTETRAQTKARLLRQVKEDNWDPYSSDMTMDEFYALMELFQEGALPLEDEGPSTGSPAYGVPIIGAPGVEEPSIEDEPGVEGPPAQPSSVYIPREMFLFSGLNPEGTTDANGENITTLPGIDNTYGSSLPYNNNTGADGDDASNYPAGLDPYGGYTRPPEGWPGIDIGSSMSATVVVPGINNGNTAVSGDVDQRLFLAYENVYVRQVTVQNNPVTVLGAIQQPKTGEWVYYYTTDEDQLIQVSATTLGEGQKFVIQYAHREYSISYQIRYRATEEELDANGRANLWGYNLVRSTTDYTFDYYDNYSDYEKYCDEKGIKADIADWVRQLPRLENETQREDLAKAIFGDEFPTKTDEGKYAFTATAPAGYTLAFYLSDKKDDDGTWINGSAQLVTPEGFTGEPGEYKDVNQGWALGMEPVYVHDGDKLMPNESKGPQELLTTGTFYNNDVDADRIVVAVLRKKPTPEFDAYSYFHEVDANGDYHGIDNNVVGRGTVAPRTVKATNKTTGKEETILYDYEDVFLWATGGASKYNYTISGLGTTASIDNMKVGNVATVDGWTWNNAGIKLLQDTMTLNEEDGTYSFRWTWQTNTGEGPRGYLLDTLEINRMGITIPFFSKNSFNGEFAGFNDYPAPEPDHDPDDPEDMGGIRTWFAKTKLPDGTVVLVELLMVFNPGNTQRVYRITVTGARNNVTVTNMNVMQYGSGAPEIAVYQLDGVTGATEKDKDGNPTGVRRTAMQFYSKNNGWNTGKEENQYNTYRGEVIVDQNGDGVDYVGGDSDYAGANIRFKLANGYSNPAYLLETSRNGTISSTNGEIMASIDRDGAGNLLRSTQNPVIPYISDGDDPYMRYDESGVPYPVSADGKKLYYYDDNGEFVQFTDPSALRVRAETMGDVLAPELYLSADGTKPDSGPLAASAVIAPDNTPTFKWDEGKPLNTQYIYSGKDGWYYIRLNQRNTDEAKMALLAIVAFPTRYVVRYKPNMIPAVMGENDEVIVPEREPENMPVIDHYGDCPTFLQGDPEDDPDDDRVKHEFDDNAGFFYDVETYADAAINHTRPYDDAGYYRFVDWMLVDENDQPVKQYVKDPEDPSKWLQDEDGNFVTQEVHFASGAIHIRDYAEVAILNGDLGTTANDVYVLRLIPTWEQMENPYHYKVALRWVDAQGKLHEEYFDDESEGYLWQEVLTDFKQEDESLGPAVKVLTEATPFQNWIALHPTYNFWDAVNNATGTEDEIKNAVHEALIAYLPVLDDNASQADRDNWEKNYKNAFDAILDRDRKYEESDENFDKYREGNDFDPLGNYAYTVYEDYGTIVVWMYEDKGGMVFHKAVDAEPFITDEEFYFTVRQVIVGNNDQRLNDTYKAYPETVYDERTGAERAVKDSDAWLVTFKDGDITSIVKNDGSTRSTSYFTMKNGEGIRLYVPGGTYTITELGSKSGGTYRTEVTLVAAEDVAGTDIKKGMEQVPRTGWQFPTEYKWLTGSSKAANADDKDQVSATVNFEVGAHDVAHVINFSNQTSVVAIESQVYGPYYGERLGYTITLILPDGTTPLKDEDENGKEYYYFNFNLYDVTYAEGGSADYKPQMEDLHLDLTNAPPAKGTSEYQNWLTEKQATWLNSEAYQEWLAWHAWRPEGTTTVNTFGRLVVTEDPSKSNHWIAASLLTPVYDNSGLESVQTGWKDSTYSGNGVIGLTSGQRFYVVCTVPKQDSDINYYINEADAHGYKADITREREGTAAAAELAYELFINTKLAGMPKTGGMGDGAFRVAGLTFLASGLGLVCVNRKGKRRDEEELSDPAEWR